MTTLQLGDPLPNYWWFERQWISRTCPQVDKCCQSIHCKPYCFWHVQWLYWFSTQHHPLLLCNSCCKSALLLLFSLIIDTKHQLISSITTSTDLKYQLDLFSIWNLEKRSVDSFLSACKSPPLWRLVWVLGRFLARWFGQIGLGPSDTSVHRWHLPQHLIPSPYQLNLTGSSVFAAPPPQIFENLTAPAFLAPLQRIVGRNWNSIWFLSIGNDFQFGRRTDIRDSIRHTRRWSTSGAGWIFLQL